MVLAVGSKVFVTPFEITDDLAGIGVEQQLVRVEQVAPVGSPQAVSAQAVNQARAGAGQVAMPDITGVGGQHQAAQFSGTGFVKQAQRHDLRMR